MSNYLNFPESGIGTHEVEKLFEWLNKYPEPDLWHQMVFSLNYDQRHTMDYVLWIAQQPECDVATAVSALSLTQAYECIYSDLAPSDHRVFELAEIICAKSENDEFTRSEIGGVDSMLDLSSTALLKVILEGCSKNLPISQKPYLPIPQKLLSRKISEYYSKTNYYVEENCVVRIDSLDERARTILGYYNK